MQISTPPATPPATLGGIFLVFFRIGILSFGGGLSGWVFREVVTLRHWLDEDEFFSGLAVSQILPGTNISNLAVYVGNRLKGPLGAITALTGLLSGPFFAVIGLATIYSAVRATPFVDAALDGITAAAIGLILVVIFKGARRAVQRPEALVAFAVAFAAVGLLHWPLLTVVVIVGPLSVAAAWWRVRAQKADQEASHGR